jgi:hypothetical protein
MFFDRGPSDFLVSSIYFELALVQVVDEEFDELDEQLLPHTLLQVAEQYEHFVALL